jgi:hypothetical protein
MRNELPLHKETMLVFIQYIGNKDTSAVYPKSLRVNRKNVLEAILLLKKHNPFYADVSIKEENLDWMHGEEEVSIATNAFKLKTKKSKQYKIITGESKYTSPAHNTGLEVRKNITDDNKSNPSELEIFIHA